MLQWSISRKLFVFFCFNKRERGSSETIRKISCFLIIIIIIIINIIIMYKIKEDQKFIDWFIGFSEGNGSFIVSRDCCFFILTQKDSKILFKIKKKLGFGSVSKYGTFFRYIVSKDIFIKKLLCLFNGNLILNTTIIKLKKWYDFLQIKEFAFSEFKKNLVTQNAWFSGFIDACGFFKLAFKKKDKGSSFLLFELFFDTSFESYFIADIELIFALTFEKKSKDFSFMFLKSYMENKKFLSYFEKYTLRTTKKYNYLKVKKMLLAKEDKIR